MNVGDFVRHKFNISRGVGYVLCHAQGSLLKVAWRDGRIDVHHPINLVLLSALEALAAQAD